MDEETYTPPEAARILRLSRRRVTQMLNAGEFEGRQDESGRWHIPQGVVHARLKDRPARGRPDDQEPRQGASGAAQEAAELRDRAGSYGAPVFCRRFSLPRLGHSSSGSLFTEMPRRGFLGNPYPASYIERAVVPRRTPSRAGRWRSRAPQRALRDLTSPTRVGVPSARREAGTGVADKDYRGPRRAPGH